MLFPRRGWSALGGHGRGTDLDPKLFATVFAAIFVAELGDKTQLATLLFSAKGEASRLTVFLAAASALVATSAIGVLGGAVLSSYVSGRTLELVAGIGFIAIGAWILWRA